MNNRKSPIKQQRTKNPHFLSVSNSNHIRSNSSMNLSYLKNLNSHHRYYSHANSPVAMSASSLPAVPLFYSETYADPPECSLLPKPPESWYLNSNDENLPIEIEEKKEIPKQKIQRKSYRKNHNNNHNKGFYSPCYSTRNHEKIPTQYISVKG
ncbi:unnamed protein product [Rotaria sordida]|uniref:Uncharacterized protein n=1 Tax=Rotaria sordida TaxID=392033 RepID=A0A813XS43_9BILA|nr:unnamed protein product [Rotaria sordida]CAF0943002.1 unnamed protein product [Rotaria sordida]CAF1178592.1 unnamed protein product [Rotaria sordida]CAF1467765.1 unnamed protein product [Rotaria sordida]CAF1644099.1 unnamed protein product [Rotaria sordida]